MNEFRDEIGDAIAEAIASRCERPTPLEQREAAQAVLDMPEMHALRTFLAREFRTYNQTPSRSRALMIDEGIPANVADWVLS